MKKTIALLVLSAVIIMCSPLTAQGNIFEACINGDIPEVRDLVEKDPKIVSATDDDSATPLHHCVAKNHLELTNFLIGKGANVNAAKNDGVTPLHIAAAMGHTEIARVLVENGAEIDKADKKGRTPVGLAENRGHPALAKMLQDFKKPENNTPTAKPDTPDKPHVDNGQAPNVTSGPKPPKMSTPEVKPGDPERAKTIIPVATEFVDKLTRGEFTSARELMNDDMKKNMSESDLRLQWSSIKQHLGLFVERQGTMTQKIDNIEVVLVQCRFEKSTVNMQLAFDDSDKISGLYIKPVNTEENN